MLGPRTLPWVVIARGIASASRPKLVVLGSGWAAVKIMRDIDSAAYDVTFLSCRDHMLFTPYAYALHYLYNPSLDSLTNFSSPYGYAQYLTYPTTIAQGISNTLLQPLQVM